MQKVTRGYHFVHISYTSTRVLVFKEVYLLQGLVIDQVEINTFAWHTIPLLDFVLVNSNFNEKSQKSIQICDSAIIRFLLSPCEIGLFWNKACSIPSSIGFVCMMATGNKNGFAMSDFISFLFEPSRHYNYVLRQGKNT